MLSMKKDCLEVAAPDPAKQAQIDDANHHMLKVIRWNKDGDSESSLVVSWLRSPEISTN